LRNATTEPVNVTPPRAVRRVSKMKREPTNQDAQVACYKVQGGDITYLRHHATEAGHDSSQADHGVQRSDGLRQVSSGCPTTDYKT
jgi:hypothetical protein